ncbi:MAG TPA: zf-TFIIB domain-containing protein [Pyrinomonadaceae bacterium]|nr:zf-TFIIB domain-containing protein [Pyrinomonadaceae bacterium]
MFDGEKCFRCWKWHKFEELTAGPHGFSLCPRCAAKLSNEGKEKRRCPADNGELVKEIFGIVIADKCETCGGVWLDADELRALTEFIKREPWRRGLLTEIFFT